MAFNPEQRKPRVDLKAEFDAAVERGDEHDVLIKTFGKCAGCDSIISRSSANEGNCPNCGVGDYIVDIL